jgi:hypothetical protein
MSSKWQMPTALKCQLAKSSRSYGGMQLSIKNKLNQSSSDVDVRFRFDDCSDQRGQKEAPSILEFYQLGTRRQNNSGVVLFTHAQHTGRKASKDSTSIF